MLVSQPQSLPAKVQAQCVKDFIKTCCVYYSNILHALQVQRAVILQGTQVQPPIWGQFLGLVVGIVQVRLVFRVQLGA